MKSTKCLWIMWILSALPGCAAHSGRSNDDDYLAGVPEVSALQLAVTDDPNSEGTATDADAVDAAEDIAQAIEESSSEPPEQMAAELAHGRQAISGISTASFSRDSTSFRPTFTYCSD